MKQLVIHGGNPVYGFKGILFHRNDSLGHQIVHEVDDDIAEGLLADENSPWREIDDNGEVVPNARDEEAASQAATDDAARTFTVPQPQPQAPEPEAKSDKKTITIKAKAKDGAGDLSLADLKANGGAKDGTTEEAVEV